MESMAFHQEPSLKVLQGGAHLEVESKIFATRTHPTGHPQAGEPYEQQIGLMRRLFKKDHRGMEVYHDILSLDTRFHGAKIGTTILKNLVSNYPRLGVEEITNQTDWAGSYVWGRMGFSMSDAHNKSYAMYHFGEDMHGMQKGARALFKSPGVKYTAAELVEMHDVEKLPAHEVFSTKVPHYNPATGKMELVQPWKDFMLGGVWEEGGWKGSLKLTDGDPGYEHFKRYVGIAKEGGTPSYVVKVGAEVPREAKVVKTTGAFAKAGTAELATAVSDGTRGKSSSEWATHLAYDLDFAKTPVPHLARVILMARELAARREANGESRAAAEMRKMADFTENTLRRQMRSYKDYTQESAKRLVQDMALALQEIDAAKEEA
jgi:hypothetical protein